LSQNSAMCTSLMLKPSGRCVVHSTVTLLYRFDHSGWCLCRLHSAATRSIKAQALANEAKVKERVRPLREGERRHLGRAATRAGRSRGWSGEKMGDVCSERSECRERVTRAARVARRQERGAGGVSSAWRDLGQARVREGAQRLCKQTDVRAQAWECEWEWEWE
jgi:hypothetical protein